MSDAELPPLPTDIEKLLREAPRPVPPSGFGEGVLSRIKGTVGPPPPPPSVPRGASGISKMGAWGVPVSVAALVVGVSAGLFVGVQLAQPPVLPAQVIVQAAPPVEVVVTAPAPVAAPVVIPAPVHREPAPTKPPRAEPPRRDFDLSDERSLVEMARTALGRRETQKATEALLEHGRRFPNGQLAEERESLLIQAYVNAGGFDVARKRAAEFKKRFPESMLLPAVDAALGAIP